MGIPILTLPETLPDSASASAPREKAIETIEEQIDGLISSRNQVASAASAFSATMSATFRQTC